MTGIPSFSRRTFIGGALTSVSVSSVARTASAQTVATAVDPSSLRNSKRTPLGLYLTPTQAHQALEADPGTVFVDVRDPIEVSFVGHPEGLNAIVPLRVTTHDVDLKSHQYKAVSNPDFVAQFDAAVAALNKNKNNRVFVTCRSGSRSAVATRQLVAAGYIDVWNLVEGFEGDKAEDGSRSVNGWRNAGLPWAYRLAPGVAWSA